MLQYSLQELEEVTREREMWTSLLKLLPWPELGWAEFNVWVETHLTNIIFHMFGDVFRWSPNSIQICTVPKGFSPNWFWELFNGHCAACSVVLQTIYSTLNYQDIRTVVDDGTMWPVEVDNTTRLDLKSDEVHTMPLLHFGPLHTIQKHGYYSFKL